MKKFTAKAMVAIAMVGASAAFLVGCGSADGAEPIAAKAERGRIFCIYNHISGAEVWVDNETGVEYFYKGDGYSGGLSVLVNADGTPKVWNGNEEGSLDE